MPKTKEAIENLTIRVVYPIIAKDGKLVLDKGDETRIVNNFAFKQEKNKNV